MQNTARKTITMPVFTPRTAPPQSATEPVLVVSNETDAEISARIAERFEILGDLTDMVIDGNGRSLIVSGPAGIGKSYTIEQKVSSLDDNAFVISKGFIRPTGLYKLLYEYRLANQVIVMDDSDCVFYDEISLNLIKAAADTTERRTIAWRAETNMKTEDGEPLPTSFDFAGALIFITNKDFDAMIASKDRMSPHYEALVSRSFYVDFLMRTRREYFIRIKDVVYNEGMLSDILTDSQINLVMNYISDNLDNLREVSLRIAIKIANIIKSNDTNWRKMCNVTCCKK